MDPTTYLPEAVKPEQPKSRLRALAIETLQTIALAGVFYLAISLMTARVVVEGPSMRPTLLSGEWIVVDRMTYKFSRPQRGDVIVFLPPTNAQTDDLIKRVIGLPGETVEIRGGSVWINGNMLAEPYAAGTSTPDNQWQLEAEELFVMGDNRVLSLDSRSFGPVTQKEVVGKAWLIYWPPAEWGPLNWRINAGSTTAYAPSNTFRYNILHRFVGSEWPFLSRDLPEDERIS
jgi:signal peptidase I